ncbi:MAG: Uma2 family endonuclease, partial [Trichodesmium sp. MAG_R04]|nr:Uma2 family endonuclease [Trichodesmium sp. MAG_R04]
AMSEKLTLPPHEYPDTTNMILEDDTPLDSFIDEKQQRLLTNELGSKLIDYAKLSVPYYIVYDPLKKLSQTALQIFQLYGSSYIPKNDAWFADINLGLTL